MVRRRSKKNENLLPLLFESHWGVSAGVAVASLLFFELVIPAMLGRSPILSQIPKALAPLGWIVSGAFALIALVRFFQMKLANRKDSAGNTLSIVTPLRPSLRTATEPSLCPSPVIDPSDLTVFGAAGFKRPAKPTEWSLALLQSIDWKRFEEVVAAYFRAKGLRCETQTHGADGGIDARIYAPEVEHPMALVQCKAWKSKPVGVAMIRELLGVMTHEKVERGFFMITGEFSPDALTFAESHRITLVSGYKFLEMIRLQSPEVQAALLEVATEGDYLVPTCASCGVKMVDRGKFWGCANYPKCRNKIYVAA